MRYGEPKKRIPGRTYAIDIADGLCVYRETKVLGIRKVKSPPSILSERQWIIECPFCGEVSIHACYKNCKCGARLYGHAAYKLR